jgi:hypothetical protein
MSCRLFKNGKYEEWPFYESPCGLLLVGFPWKNIWCVKVPRKVTLFGWTIALGKILTIDINKLHFYLSKKIYIYIYDN